MRKTFYLFIYFSLTFSSFAQNTPEGSLFIEGTAHIEGYIAFFTERFTEEAIAAGYTAAESPDKAAYTFKFEITDNTEGTGISEPAIRIVIINNSDSEEILDFEYYFGDLNEMYDYAQFLFQRASFSMPLPRKSDFIDISWQNKLMYLRLSFDYPITFYALQPDGLRGGIGIYAGDYSNPSMVSPQDNKFLAMPGVTVGFEFQFLNFMSLELNLQFSLGDTRDNTFINFLAGAELKFPLKFFQHIIIEPYLAFTIPITVSEDVFSEYPSFFTGGGFQIGTKGGKNGSFFVDAGFMFSFSKTGMKNPYISLYPKPSVIYYNQYTLKLAVGYKHGFINRKNSKLLVNYY